jgi:hypothetical protein
MTDKTNILTASECAEIRERAELHIAYLHKSIPDCGHYPIHDIPRLLAHIDAQAAELDQLRRQLALCTCANCLVYATCDERACPRRHDLARRVRGARGSETAMVAPRLAVAI